jgi:hypothetical protein
MMIVLGALHKAHSAPGDGHCDSLHCQSGAGCFPDKIRRIAVLARIAAR